MTQENIRKLSGKVLLAVSDKIRKLSEEQENVRMYPMICAVS